MKILTISMISIMFVFIKNEKAYSQDNSVENKLYNEILKNEELTKSNCQGNGKLSFISSSPDKKSLELSICRHWNTGNPVNITDYQCEKSDNGFYKCFASIEGQSRDWNFKLRYTNGIWKIYSAKVAN